MKLIALSAAFCVFHGVATVAAATINVPADFPTISSAIASATAGDEVVVAVGVYTENINFGGKSIVVRSSAGPETTVIESAGTGPVVTFDSGESLGSVLEGFTIRLGVTTDICGIAGCDIFGGGIHIAGASPTIIGNVITQNQSVGVGVLAGMGSGGGMLIINGAPVIRHNLFFDNTALGSGGGLACTDSSPLVENNTFVGNEAAAGAGFWANGGAPVVRNNIFWDNSGTSEVFFAGPVAANVTYSDVQGGFPGTGNINLDPLFVDAGLANFHLSPGSPCIDAGDPLSPLDPDGTVVDLGAFSTGASSTFIRRGDCNNDGSVNIADAIFELSLLFPAPGVPIPVANCDDACDANDDGDINIADAIAVLGSLFGSTPNPLPAPGDSCGVDPTIDALSCPSSSVGCP